VVGLDFRDARAKLAEQGMQAVLRFDDAPAGTLKVLGINPADAKIASGISVTLQISGAAPAIAAEELAGAVGLPCQDAKAKLVKAGLLIGSYAGGVQDGALLSVDPALAGLKFNDRVVLTCGVAATPDPTLTPAAAS
jgi:beta-lactam-binding protein with PASTA domain